MSQLSASERKMREKRREIEWHRKKTEYEISETEWEKTNTERLAAQAQNRVYNEDWQKKEQESLATPPQRREPSTGEIGMMHESKMANGKWFDRTQVSNYHTLSRLVHGFNAVPNANFN